MGEVVLRPDSPGKAELRVGGGTESPVQKENAEK